MITPEQELLTYIPRLRCYARVLCGVSAVIEADDLVQDCIVQALAKLHSWQVGSDLRAWLFSIMHNIFINQAKKKQRELCNASTLQANDTIRSNVELPDQQLELRDMALAFEKLNVDQRTILSLVVLDGLSYREVAQVLDVPEGTVMSRLARARQQLRTCLSADQFGTLRVVK